MKKAELVEAVAEKTGLTKADATRAIDAVFETISKALEKRIVTNCLYKSKNIVAQSTLNKQEREENIKNVYTIKNQNILLNKKVLLVDDIYTTGSTANECCKILLKAKPNKIGVMTLAKD